jgi:hypothetical protein
MSKRKTVRKSKTSKKANSVKKSAARKKVAAPRTATQEALQVTWLLKGNLKNAQLAYLRIGALLSQVRDKKLYAELKHADIEDYAEKRLQLGKTSLYRYILVYDWVNKTHPEWLKPKPQGFIPDLSDIADLIWIEKELDQKDVKPAEKAWLEELRKKALQGQLRKGETDKIRRRGLKMEDSLKSYISKLRNLRMRASQLASMPAEVITHLDAAIDILKNAQPLAKCGINDINFGQKLILA